MVGATIASRMAKSEPRVIIVVSRYNAGITGRLLDGALQAFRARCPAAAAPMVVDAPGAFDLPALCLAAAQRAGVEGVLALGCIIKGETMHDRVIADAVAGGLVGVTLRTGMPVALGVLTVNTLAQARARAGGRHGNKGAESMDALLDSILAIRSLRTGRRAGASSVRPDKSGRRS
jgi:6,7-dimethyl-8-ribityllumazine synthase